MTHNLVTNYGLLDKMDVFVRPRSALVASLPLSPSRSLPASSRPISPL